MTEAEAMLNEALYDGKNKPLNKYDVQRLLLFGGIAVLGVAAGFIQAQYAETVNTRISSATDVFKAQIAKASEHAEKERVILKQEIISYIDTSTPSLTVQAQLRAIQEKIGVSQSDVSRHVAMLRQERGLEEAFPAPAASAD